MFFDENDLGLIFRYNGRRKKFINEYNITSLNEMKINNIIAESNISSETNTIDPNKELKFDLNPDDNPQILDDSNMISDNKRWGSKEILFESIELFDGEGKKKRSLESGKPFKILMKYKIEQPVEDAVFGIGIFRNDGMRCYGTNTEIDHISIDLKQKEGVLTFVVPDNSLLPGEYLLDVAAHRHDGFPYDYCKEYLSFTVFSILQDVGIMSLGHEWKHSQK